MSQVNVVMIGNDFVMPKSSLPKQTPAVEVKDYNKLPLISAEVMSSNEILSVALSKVEAPSTQSNNSFDQLLDLVHKNSIIVFAILFLLVGASGIVVGSEYWNSRIVSDMQKTTSPVKNNSVAGLNLTVPAADLASRLSTITAQTATLEVGDHTLNIGPATIKSWLTLTPSADNTQDYIHLNSQAMTQSLTADAQKYAVTPVNQVTITQNGVSTVIVAGQNGTKLSDPRTIVSQAASSAKSVMNGSGISFNTPVSTQAFQTVTPAAFSKLLVANLTTNRLYAYQNGQLVNTFLSSDGKPSTPTPVGEFHIWTKLTSQTMIGPGYVQPDVPYVNYFDHYGDAVHGVYWRPASVFGYESLSHGCVGLQVSNAEWVYNWAPIGTTVITYNS